MGILLLCLNPIYWGWKLVAFPRTLAYSQVFFDPDRVKHFLNLGVIFCKVGNFVWKSNLGLLFETADKGACLHMACPLQLTLLTWIHLVRFTHIWSAWLLFPVEFKTPALLGWIDFSGILVYLWVLNLTTLIRNSAAGLGADGSDFSHSKKSSGGQGRYSHWGRSYVSLTLSRHLLCHLELVACSCDCSHHSRLFPRDLICILGEERGKRGRVQGPTKKLCAFLTGKR